MTTTERKPRFRFDGAVFVHRGVALALLWKTNLKGQWVFRWSNPIQEWISAMPYTGQPLGERLPPEQALLYGVIDDGRAIA